MKVASASAPQGGQPRKKEQAARYSSMRRLSLQLVRRRLEEARSSYSTVNQRWNRNVLDKSKRTKKLRVQVLGLRGIPNVEGGVETHAEHLYPRLARMGCDVEVITRSPYMPPGRVSFGPVRLRRIWAPK